MGTILPDKLMHLRTTVVCSAAECDTMGIAHTFERAAKLLVASVTEKLLRDHVKVRPITEDTCVRALELNCFVLTEEELLTIIANARQEGAHDAVYWSHRVSAQTARLDKVQEAVNQSARTGE